MKAKDFVTLEQLAEEMGISLKTLYDWKKRGLPFIEIGKVVRIYKPYFFKWLLSHEKAAKTPGSAQQGDLFGR